MCKSTQHTIRDNGNTACKLRKQVPIQLVYSCPEKEKKVHCMCPARLRLMRLFDEWTQVLICSLRSDIWVDYGKKELLPNDTTDTSGQDRKQLSNNIPDGSKRWDDACPSLSRKIEMGSPFQAHLDSNAGIFICKIIKLDAVWRELSWGFHKVRSGCELVP